MADNTAVIVNEEIDESRPRVDLVKAIQCRKKGMSFQEIATLQGVSKQAVKQRIDGFLKELGDREEVQAFKEFEVDIQDAIRLKYTRRMLDDEVVNKTSGKDAAMIYGITYDKSRLERGQSTNNTSLFFHVVSEAPDLPDD